MRFFYPLLMILFFSCAVKIIPLKGNYPDKPYEIIVDKSKDKVWDNIIDLFAQKGLSIKIIDRSSGLIISERTALTWTYEDKNGKLENLSAWAVVPKIYDPGANRIVGYYNVSGDWNIRIKDAQDGKTVLNVNLVNITSENPYKSYLSQATSPIPGAKTTGVFEELIAIAIK